MSEKQTARNFSFVVLGRIVNVALQAIFYFVFAALLGPESFGKLSYLIAIGGTASVISQFGLSASVVVYHGKGDKLLVNQINVFALIATGVAAVILIPFDIGSALIAFSLSYFIMNQHNLLGMKRYKTYFIDSLIKGISILALPVLLYFFFDLPGILIGMAIGNFIGGTHFIKSLSRQTNSFREFRNNLNVIIHNFGVTISSGLPKWADKLLIMPLFGFTFVGIYQFNLQVLLGLEIFPLALQSFLLSEESSGRKHRKLVYLSIIIIIVMVIVVVTISPMVIKEIFPEYIEGILSLQIMIFALIPTAISAVFIAKLQASKSTKIGYTAIVRLGSLLPLIVIFGTMWGLVGLSLSLVISIVLNTIFLVYLYQKSQIKGSNSIV